MKARILIVDDEQVQREMLGGYLAKKGYDVSLAASGDEALDTIEHSSVDVMISDQKMPGMNGIELAGRVHAEHPNVSTIMITAFGKIEDAVHAMKNGVEDYLTKPINLDELDIILDRVLDRRQLVRENEWLREQVEKSIDTPDIIYVSEAMKEVMSTVARAASSHATVLITGESGTGKELVARAIHRASGRKSKAFVAMNCAAVPENLIESELFGHEKGAFTSADRQRIGRFEQADGGTLFLDEVGEIPPHVQVKLLRVLQERSFERVGGNVSIGVDVRIIAATNRSIEEEIRDGRFREDLYYRLNVVNIHIPPLRERKADIPVLARHYLDLYSREHGKQMTGITADALDMLVKYQFPGNIRELGNIIEQAVVLSRSGTLSIPDLPPRIRHSESDTDAGNLDAQVASLEQAALEQAMRETGGNKSAAARLLGVTERRIRYMLKKYGKTSR